jgi:hypothetical protein
MLDQKELSKNNINNSADYLLILGADDDDAIWKSFVWFLHWLVPPMLQVVATMFLNWFFLHNPLKSKRAAEASSFFVSCQMNRIPTIRIFLL